VPPLVTISPTASAGVLGRTGTQTIYGGSGIGGGPQNGVRFTAGAWLDCEQTVGLEGSYFFLGTAATHFRAATGANANTVIARPFFDAATNAENSELVLFPGVVGGTVSVGSTTRLQGAGITALQNLCCECGYRLDLLGGFTFLDLDDRLGIGENLNVTPGVQLTGGNAILVSDQFQTRNHIYAGQVGLRAERRTGNLILRAQGTLALGSNRESAHVAGTTTFINAGAAPVVQQGGLLALPTNSGHFEHDQFAFIPAFDLRVGYQISNNLTAFLGYDFLFITDVIRPGEQIDTTINPTQLPTSTGPGTLNGTSRPQFSFRSKEYWAQGVNLGVEVRY
jgi:hypothetical protein